MATKTCCCNSLFIQNNSYNKQTKNKTRQQPKQESKLILNRESLTKIEIKKHKHKPSIQQPNKKER